jgi:hypothetical protein
MAEGLKIRAAIDTENVKGLLLINGGAAVALLAFLPHVLDKPGYDSLARAILWALLLFQAGLIFAVTHNRLRRKCSLVYEQHDFRPPPCEVFGRRLSEPCVCLVSIVFMWLSVVAFCAGGATVFVGGLQSLNSKTNSEQRASDVKPSQPPTLPNPVLQKDAPGAGPPRNKHRYGAIIDAGSSGSRLTIFEWRIAGDGDPHVWPVVSVEDKDTRETECPLTSLHKDERNTCDCLVKLTKRAREEAVRFLGEPNLPPISLWIKATAGVRKLEDKDQATMILVAADRCLANSPGYEWKGAKVITGEEEGVYAWLAVNHLARTLRTDAVATHGIIELGGQSAQLAYRMSGHPSPAPTRGEILTVPLASGELHIYSISDFLGRKAAVNDPSLGEPDIIKNGCALNGVPNDCVRKINDFLCSAASLGKTCHNLKQHQVPPREMHFVGLSNFTHVVRNMGLGTGASLNVVRERAKKICGLGRNTLVRDEVLKPAGKYKKGVCFDAFYATQLAGFGWDIPLEKVSPPDSRWAGDPSWPLGAMIFEAARSDSPE